MEDYTLIPIHGFDKEGEPELKIFTDGHIEIMFNFMPPLNGKDEARDSAYWDSFEETLSTHLGVEVIRDDRELFIIPTTKKSTAEKLKLYLESYWE
jgi:hypothetical protein